MDVCMSSGAMHLCRQDRHRVAGPSYVIDHIQSRHHFCLHISRCRASGSRKRLLPRCSDDAPDWDKEMSLFRQRTMKPNQLETLRKVEAETDVGRVLFCSQGLAIVQGLDNDAPVGSTLSFVSGAQGVLLWRRSDNICFLLLLGEGTDVEIGEAVECKIKAILQVVDADRGPTTKREFMSFGVPAGAALFGHTVDFLGRPMGSKLQLGRDVTVPLFNDSPSMEMRSQINEPLLTGVKAFDALTPLGRGQAQLITGPVGSGKTSMMMDVVLGQSKSGVMCVYAAVGQRVEELQKMLRLFEKKGAMAHTCIVAAPEGSSLGEQYAAVAAACSIGERVRNAGGASLVILDDVTCMVSMWEQITKALAGLGLEAVELEKRESMSLEDEDQLVEYEGMLVSAAAAQRRRFFSSLIQRAAKLNPKLGSGSMTLLMVLPGMPARGVASPALDPAQYTTLTETQLEKLMQALQARAGVQQASETPAGSMRTEVIEEFMSITDGQVVLQKEGGAGTVDPELSISRIGLRAYPPAIKALAPQIRFELAQAADSSRFACDSFNPVAQKEAAYAAQVRAALAQAPGHPVPLHEQVAILYAIQKGYLRDVEPSKVPLRLSLYVQYLRSKQIAALRSIAASQELTPQIEEVLQQAMQATLAQFSTT